MTSVEQGASPQDPNNHHDQADIPTELSSKSIQAHGEATGVEDLRERFTAMESKLALLGDVFGLQRLEISSEEEDTEYDSDDSAVDFINQALWYIKEARRRREHREGLRKQWRAEKRVKETLKKSLLSEANRELAREVVTTALQKREPAIVIWVDWDLFVSSKRNLRETLMRPIEVVIGEPEPGAMLQLSRAMQAPNWTAQGKSSVVRFPSQASSINNPGQAPLPERVKIHLYALDLVFSKISAPRPFNPNGDQSVVFLRPFKELISYEKKLRDYLDELEKRFADGDIDLRTDFSTVDDAGGKDSKEGDEEKGPKEVEEPERSGDTGGSNDRDRGGGTEGIGTALLHLRCLVKFIDEVIKPKVEYIRGSQCRTIHFYDLWHLFKPGDEVVNQGEKQAYRIVHVQIPQHRVEYPWLRWSRKPTNNKNEGEKEDGTPVTVRCVYIDFDGKRLGPVSVKFNIPPFGGLKDIKALPIYPLRFTEDTNLRNRLIKRGKMLLDIAKFKPMYYMGFTLDTRDEIDSQVVVDFSEALADAKLKEWAPNIEPLSNDPGNGEIIICRGACCLSHPGRRDGYIDLGLTEEFFKTLIPDAGFGAPSLILSPRSLEESMPGTEDEPTDEEFVIMTYRVFGFVLRSRKWAQLDLTYLKYENSEARSSALNAFDRLELPEGHREMVQSLVTQHFRDRQAAFTRDDQADIVRGKGGLVILQMPRPIFCTVANYVVLGKGLILLLHGAPGVGKTTTAEGVAELFQKPLFQITCGDLGTTARDVEQELEKNFALASRWGCILLLDEADVFLSARERKDFARNGLVAVFLRVLEYYAGILFLTTNRIGDFDEAFASRIHMSLHYPELDEVKTKKIFKLNINLIQERFDRQARVVKYDMSAIENFAERHFREHPYGRWNGRQIRNACQTALALAEFDAHGGKIQGESRLSREAKSTARPRGFW
ncbi:hypothetical protein NUW58_g3395 [Xylaria curta]|uniref:Uncharacterized protein n=1 Tax=Xylaria curta TaxID=42375 RepID=A0ACC1PB91_9PEZI|nr:hypothetical protein NUW58_g3395 [Xylaria curta]